VAELHDLLFKLNAPALRHARAQGIRRLTQRGKHGLPERNDVLVQECPVIDVIPVERAQAGLQLLDRQRSRWDMPVRVFGH